MIQAWGMTETSPLGTIARLKSHLRHNQVDYETKLSFRLKAGVRK